MALLEVNDLRTYFKTRAGEVHAVDGVSFQLESGKTLGIVGESGCGKSVTAFSIMGLVLPPGRVEVHPPVRKAPRHARPHESLDKPLGGRP